MPADSCRKGKDPGSAFGPEAVPLATGLVPVVYWVPGPPMLFAQLVQRV